VASGSALSRMGREAAAADPDGVIARIGRSEGAVTGHTVTTAAQQNDPTALDIFNRLGRWLGIGIASLATIFELEAVVIGGGVIRTGDLLLTPVRAAAREYANAPEARGVPPVTPATFGSEAGMIGAGLLALEHTDRKPSST
jgi:glucokinase